MAKIVQAILDKNPCYRAGKKITVKGLMLHSVGTPQPRAEVFTKAWNDPNYTRACVHAFIDGNSGWVYQCLPWNHRGWHAGGTANNTHIGVEMCEPSQIKYTSGSAFTVSDAAKARETATRTYNSAVELFADLCTRFNLNPMTSGVIVSHKEGHAKGIASNHGDPEHLWKGLNLPYTMDKFRKDVLSKMSGKPPENVNTGFLVRVNTPVLNVRAGAGTSYKINTTVRQGEVFTIVDTSGSWGKLKSGAGWISLNYCVKI